LRCERKDIVLALGWNAKFAITKMNSSALNPDRRTFLKAIAAASAGFVVRGIAGAAEGSAGGKKGIKLGLDNFAVRAMNWKAPALLDYAASLKLDSILISDLDAFESLEAARLRE